MGGVEVGARLCDQNPCRERATVYAMDRLAGGWAGYYCEPCASGLGFVVTDYLEGSCE